MLFIFPEIPCLVYPCYLGQMGAPANNAYLAKLFTKEEGGSKRSTWFVCDFDIQFYKLHSYTYFRWYHQSFDVCNEIIKDQICEPYNNLVVILVCFSNFYGVMFSNIETEY